MNTTNTKLWQTLALSVSMGAVATSSMAMMGDRDMDQLQKHIETQKQEHERRQIIQKTKNGEDITSTEKAKIDPSIPPKNTPIEGLPLPVGGLIAGYLDPKDLSALQQTSKKAHRFVENAKGPYQKFATDIRNDFSLLLNDSMNLWNKTDFVKKIRQTYPKNTVDILLGCLHLAAGNFNEGMYLFKGKTLPKSLQESLNRATYNGTLGFTDETGRKYLEDRVNNHKDMHAEELLNRAAYHGGLGFKWMTKTERQQYLEDRANNHKDAHAQERLNLAAYEGDLGFTNETGPKYLETIALDENNPGRQNAQERLNQAAYDGGLGFMNKTETERQQYLEDRANKYNDTDAQECFNHAAYYGRLGFMNKTETERQQYLEDRANKYNDTHAQESLNWAAYDGDLGFMNKTETERQQYLEDRVNNHKDTHAQERLNQAASNGKLGFTNETEQREYLEKIASNVNNPGSKDAQEMLNRAASNGELGFTESKNLPWFFEFYNVVQSMGNEHVKQPPAPQNNENEIIESNENNNKEPSGMEDID